MTMHTVSAQTAARHAALDEAHIGHIHGALGTILQEDHGPRTSWRHRFRTLLAILGPGLIVMVGDNDAGAFGTYTAVIALLVMLSIILTASVLFPATTNATVILSILGGGTLVAVLTAAATGAIGIRRPSRDNRTPGKEISRDTWRMPPLNQLPASKLSRANRIWMAVLRVYLFIAGGLVLVRIVQLTISGQG